MWGGSALAKKWGATKTVGLNDGLGQGNNIAVFPSKVRGAAAQFDLWHTSPKYHNKPLRQAIATWSGGNYVRSYLDFLTKRTPGLTDDTPITDTFLSSPTGIAFVKAQAWHEAGKPYPMADDEWKAAQSLVYGPSAVKLPTPSNHLPAPSGAVIAATSAGLSAGAVIGVAVAAAAIAAIIYFIMKNRAQKALDTQIAFAEAALARAKNTDVKV